VVDLFRFSCTVACLLESGKKNIEIFSNPDLAAARYRTLKNAELFSEMALPVSGQFDNSPYKVMTASDPAKTAVVVTCSGAKAVMNSVNAGEIVIGGFHNLNYVVEYLKKREEEILLVPACVFYDRKHVEDFIACEAFYSVLTQPPERLPGAGIKLLPRFAGCSGGWVTGWGKPEDFMLKIHDTPRILELMGVKPETAKDDLELIMKIGNIGAVPRAVIRGVYASVENAL